MDFSQFADVPVMGAWLQFVPLIASAVGKIASSMSKGRAEGRQAEVNVAQGQDQAALDRARLAEDQAARQQDTAFKGANLDIDRREYTDKARSTGYKDQAYGGLLQGLQDFSVQAPEGVEVGQISGGLRPSAMIGKEALGREMSRGAIQRRLEGSNFAPVESVANPEIPGLSELPKAGKLDSFLNIASLISNLVGGVGEAATAIKGTGSGVGTGGVTNTAAGNAGRIIRNGVRF